MVVVKTLIGKTGTRSLFAKGLATGMAAGLAISASSAPAFAQDMREHGSGGHQERGWSNTGDTPARTTGGGGGGQGWRSGDNRSNGTGWQTGGQGSGQGGGQGWQSRGDGEARRSSPPAVSQSQLPQPSARPSVQGQNWSGYRGATTPTPDRSREWRGDAGRPSNWNADQDRGGNADRGRRWDQDRSRDRDQRRDGGDRARSDRDWSDRGRSDRGWSGQGWSGQGWSDRGRPNQGWSDRRVGAWNRDWRRDNRYDWRDWRSDHREVYRMGRYSPPYRSWSYRRLSIGFLLDIGFYGSNYWISDPWMYRLPPAYPPYRWVRYYDDAMLVDTYSGEVVDVIYDFFW